MSTDQLVILSSIMTVSTVVLVAVFYVVFKTPKFDPVKTLNIRKGVYQSVKTGSIVEVHNIDGNMVYIADGMGTWNIRYDVFDSQFKYVGDL